MSNTTILPQDSNPLQLDFFQPGQFNSSMQGVDHIKTTPFAIVLQVQAGRYEIRCRQKEFELLPGQTLLAPSNEETRFLHHDGENGIMKAHWIHFRYRLFGVRDFLTLFQTPLLLPEACFTEVAALISAANKLPSSFPMPQLLVQEHVWASRLLQILLSGSTPGERAWQTLQHSRLHAVLRYIQAHLHTPLKVEELARMANLSSSRFHCVFKKEIGCSPMHYVKTQRLELAARLLATSDQTLGEIGEKTGHSDAFHLSHAFKKQHGISPRAYRKQAAHWGFC